MSGFITYFNDDGGRINVFGPMLSPDLLVLQVGNLSATFTRDRLAELHWKIGEKLYPLGFDPPKVDECVDPGKDRLATSPGTNDEQESLR